jgi:AmiR/NasT family two-component response regulator
VAVARELRPDVLFDIRMPGIDGVEATRQLAGPGVKNPLAIVVITTFDLDEYVQGALKAVARGFLLKDAGPEGARVLPELNITTVSRRSDWDVELGFTMAWRLMPAALPAPCTPGPVASGPRA